MSNPPSEIEWTRIRVAGTSVNVPKVLEPVIMRMCWMGIKPMNLRTTSVAYDGRFNQKFAMRLYLWEFVSLAMGWHDDDEGKLFNLANLPEDSE